MNITLDNLINVVKSYNPDEVDIVRRAYEYASNLHEGQYRQSGEPYIMHPLNVALILAEMHADRDTICAGLLHDTLEDTNITKEDIDGFNNTTYTCIYMISNISNMIAPILPNASLKIKQMLELPKYKWEESKMSGNYKITNLEVLYDRLDEKNFLGI